MIEPVSVAAHHPRLLIGMGAFEEALLRSRRVDTRLKSLAELQAAAGVGCPFWLDIGSAEAREAGITEEQLHALPEYRDSPLFSELEKLVMDYAVAMTGTPQEVSDELFGRLRHHLDDAQVVELTYLIGWENFRSRTNHAMGIGAAGFSDGAVCAVPRRQPASEPAAS
jgi:alkylhydroperoxidase family enzyme